MTDAPRQPADRLSRMIRSGLRRYPAHLAGSVVTPAPRSAGAVSTQPSDRFSRPDPASAVWLGHATVLLRLGSRWVLTDPVFSDRVGPRIAGRTMGVSRREPPPIEPANLPPIDIVLLSHAHFDHLDLPSLRALASERTLVVTAAKTADLIPGGYRGVVELEPGEAHREHGIRITAFEPNHWGSRYALDRWRGCNAYLVESDDGRQFFAGDTALTRNFEKIGRVDLSIFGIGAYDPWEHAHATPEQAWRMAADLGSDRLLPMHHSTFELSDEPHGEPLARLLEAAGDDRATIVRLDPGQLWTPNGD